MENIHSLKANQFERAYSSSLQNQSSFRFHSSTYIHKNIILFPRVLFSITSLNCKEVSRYEEQNVTRDIISKERIKIKILLKRKHFVIPRIRIPNSKSSGRYLPSTNSVPSHNHGLDSTVVALKRLQVVFSAGPENVWKGEVCNIRWKPDERVDGWFERNGWNNRRWEKGRHGER